MSLAVHKKYNRTHRTKTNKYIYSTSNKLYTLQIINRTQLEKSYWTRLMGRPI